MGSPTDNSGNNSWLDSLANKVGISSKSLGLNTAEDKAARVAEANAKAEAEYQAQKEQARQEYEAMAAANAADAEQQIIKQAMQGIGQQVQDQSIKGSPVTEESMWDKIRHGATSARQAVFSPDPKSAYGKALGAVASPAGLSTIGALGAGLVGMNMNKQGTEQANAAYDASLNKFQQATDANTALYGGVADSPEQLAMRQQALQGLSDRASMGLTPEDQAALAGINRQASQQFKANQATIGQDMARRGMANSGLGMARSMGAADQALQNQALAGQSQAAQSFAAKQGALTNLAGQSNAALNADYTRQMGKAANLGAVNQFNAQQQAATLQKQGEMRQASQGAKAQGVQNITQGVLGALNPNKPK